MSTPNSEIDQTEHEPVPDMLAELGPLAYGLFVLSEPGPLGEIRSLADDQAAHVPTQANRSPEPEGHHDALLGELGELDL